MKIGHEAKVHIELFKLRPFSENIIEEIFGYYHINSNEKKLNMSFPQEKLENIPTFIISSSKSKGLMGQ